MPRWTTKLATLSLLVAAGAATLYVFQFGGGTAGTARERERRDEHLRAIAKRLQVERRVADVIVIDQRPSTRPATAPTTGPATAPATTQPVVSPGGGATFQTTLLFVEYDRDGRPLPAKAFTIDGDLARVDGVVIRFDGKFADEYDALRGQAVALLTRLFGEDQPPEKALSIDPRNDIPHVYRGDGPKVTEFERTLWQQIWRLAEDEAYRKEMGVRVVRPAAVRTRFQPDRLYTLALETDGGLHVSSRPLQGVYRDALRRHALLD
jgi:hypothetical protein